jgi:serine/threonine protein kinase
MASNPDSLERATPPGDEPTIDYVAPDEVFADDFPPELAAHPRYRVRRSVGRGGMGRVYLAEHTLMQRTVILKTIRCKLAGRPAIAERFLREVRATARLSHPNIVAVYDAENVGDCLFLVMEYIDGENLRDIVCRKVPLSPTVACNYVRQAALGLEHAHTRGIIHRDIKPSNLLLVKADPDTEAIIKIQ